MDLQLRHAKTKLQVAESCLREESKKRADLENKLRLINKQKESLVSIQQEQVNKIQDNLHLMSSQLNDQSTDHQMKLKKYRAQIASLKHDLAARDDRLRIAADKSTAQDKELKELKDKIGEKDAKINKIRSELTTEQARKVGLESKYQHLQQ